MNTQVAQADPATGRGVIKFLYASGARPLAGYTIKHGVGRGGFGEVYYAVSDAGKDVALKLIRRNLDVELRGVTHCLNLKHPNLLAIFDIKQDDEDNTWVVMEYIAGESLEAAIERSPQGLPPAETCHWLRGAAAGVAYLHNHGIVHRDLKPGNIFVDEGIVKLGDYGLSKFISCSRRSGQTDSVGTVHYMAPEVANGRYGRQIDIYALGVILFESLTGRVPFEGESVGEVLMKHLTAAPDVSSLSEPYRSIVAKTLAKDPDQRFGSVEEFAAALPNADAPPPLNWSVPPRDASSPSAGATRGDEAQRAPMPPPAAAVTAPEPIWAAISDQWRRGWSWWNSPNAGLDVKVLTLFFCLYLLLKNVSSLFPIAIELSILYGVYRLVLALSRWYFGPLPSAANVGSSMPMPPTPTTPQRAAPAPQFVAATHSPIGQQRNIDKPRMAVIVKPPRERLAELLGSLLFAAGASMVISILLLLLRGKPPALEQYTWLAIVTTLSAWGVLSLSKLWDGVRGDATLRRFAMLVLGFAVGAAAWGLQSALLASLPMDPEFGRRLGDVEHPRLGAELFAADGSPLVWGFMVYFGLLFLVLRWWRQGDSLRAKRLALWSCFATALAAWIIAILCPFPQPWGVMVALGTSLVVQISSPWIDTNEAWRKGNGAR